MRPAQIAREIQTHIRGRLVELHASMRPAQIAREIRLKLPVAELLRLASMRPAQIAREISPSTVLRTRSPTCFNEARANCAGNSAAAGVSNQKVTRFNEARANCAGN